MQIKAMLRNSSNPRAVVESLANQGNQDAQIALSFLQNGMTPQQAVLNQLQQRGIPLAILLNNPLFK
jgi:hypothetical protein